MVMLPTEGVPPFSSKVTMNSAASAIVIDSVFVSKPLWFLALTMKVAVPAAVGVPLITPVVSFRFRPSGSLPSETSHAMGSVPFAKSRWLYGVSIVPPGRVSVVTVGGLSGTVSFTWIEAVTAGSGC